MASSPVPPKNYRPLGMAQGGSPDFELAARGGLCVTCKYATVIRGVRYDQQLVKCSRIDVPSIRWPVVECGQYLDKTMPWVHEMEQIAWVILTDVKTKQIGFVRVKEMSAAEREKHGIG